MKQLIHIFYVTIILFYISGCSFNNSNGISNNTNSQTPISFGPAIPISFEHPIEIKGATSPFHSDQEIIIQPKIMIG